MNRSAQKLALALMLKISIVAASTGDEINKNETQPVTTTSHVIVFDEITIDQPVEAVWPELLDFVSWYFRGEDIKHVSGKMGNLGSTFIVNGLLRHEIVGVKPHKTVVWKTCLLSSCENNIVFSDFTLRDIDGKSKLLRNSYSQGFWPEDFANKMRENMAKGIIPDSVRKISLKFKEYVENKR